jgi:hypothetical protein
VIEEIAVTLELRELNQIKDALVDRRREMAGLWRSLREATPALRNVDSIGLF